MTALSPARVILDSLLALLVGMMINKDLNSELLFQHYSIFLDFDAARTVIPIVQSHNFVFNQTVLDRGFPTDATRNDGWSFFGIIAKCSFPYKSINNFLPQLLVSFFFCSHEVLPMQKSIAVSIR